MNAAAPCVCCDGGEVFSFESVQEKQPDGFVIEGKGGGGNLDGV